MRWAAILLLLMGCSSEVAPPSGTPTTQETRPFPTPGDPPKAKRYATLEEIYSDLECESSDVIGVGNNQETLRDFGHCFQYWASLDVYLTRHGRVGSWASMTSYEPGVIGPNWVILAGSSQAAEVVQGLIGGELAGL